MPATAEALGIIELPISSVNRALTPAGINPVGTREVNFNDSTRLQRRGFDDLSGSNTPRSRERRRSSTSLRPGLKPGARKATLLYFALPVSYYLHVSQKISYSNGDQLLGVLAALASPHRLRIIAALATGGRNYVSQLARELQISRPLLHLHLQKLESAGLVTSQLELSPDGKALNYFEVCPFEFVLTPAFIARTTKSLSSKFEP